MEITTRKNGDILYIILSGTVDTMKSEILRAELDKVILEKPRKVIMDLSKVPMMGSSGIAKILIFFKKLESMKSSFEIKGVQQDLYNSFKTVRLENLFPISMK